MTKPNILFLMTDHTNSQALAPGSPCITPNLHALAAEGIQFGRCTTTNAICSPARASLMTSAYPSTHGMWDCTHTQRKEWVNVPGDRFTYFSTLLAQFGYHNGYFGKWHVEQTLKLENFGWHEYDHKTGGMKKSADVMNLVVVPKEGYKDYVLAGVDSGATDPRHPAFDQGIDFIRRSAKSGTPFCCFISASEPHDPYIPPKAFFDLYDINSIKPSPSLRDPLLDKPEVVRRLQSVWQDLSDDNWRNIMAAYWGVIGFIDYEIGRVLNVLKETGQYDNTIIVFTSDHGDMLGAHGLATKGIGTSYEDVYNIPLIIRPATDSVRPVRDVPTGVFDNQTRVSMVDIAPTILDLCNCEPIPASQVQGRSLRPVLEGLHDPTEWQDAYAEFFGQRFVYTQRIVWHDNWKYVFNPAGIDELYNLADDPGERQNLAADPAHQDMLKEMCKRMWRKMKEINDHSLFNTEYATLRTAPVGPLSAFPA